MLKNTQNNSNLLCRYKRTINNPLRLMREANKGVYTDDFFGFAELTGFNPVTLSGYMNLSLKTLTRYRTRKQKLSADKSEQLLKWIGLYTKGVSIFGQIDLFNKWMNKPAYGLGNMNPVSLMNTSTGIDLISEELQRIEFGDLA